MGVQGDNVRVECLAVAVPRPSTVTWYFNGREINTVVDHVIHSYNVIKIYVNDIILIKVYFQDFTILEDIQPDGIRSTLVIRESQEKHFGSYNCSVTNEYGTDVVEINLMPQSKFSTQIKFS